MIKISLFMPKLSDDDDWTEPNRKYHYNYNNNILYYNIQTSYW